MCFVAVIFWFLGKTLSENVGKFVPQSEQVISVLSGDGL